MVRIGNVFFMPKALPMKETADALTGAALRAWRNRLKTDPEKLAELLEISKDALYKAERGERSLHFWQILRLVDAFECDGVDQLLAGPAKPAKIDVLLQGLRSR